MLTGTDGISANEVSEGNWDIGLETEIPGDRIFVSDYIQYKDTFDNQIAFFGTNITLDKQTTLNNTLTLAGNIVSNDTAFRITYDGANDGYLSVVNGTLYKTLEIEDEEIKVAGGSSLNFYNIDQIRGVAISGTPTASIDASTGNAIFNDVVVGGTLTATISTSTSASQVSYDNSASGLLATDVKSAIDELDASLDGLNVSLRGSEPCFVGQQLYTVSYGQTISGAAPITSMIVPTSGDTIHVEGVYDVTDTDFKVVLSGVPAVTGYAINWTVDGLSTSRGEDVNQKIIPVASAYTPALSGASLNVIETAGGLPVDVLDFSNTESATYSFIMPEVFPNAPSVTLRLLFMAGGTGDANFDVSVDNIGQGDNPLTSSGYTASSESQTFAVANEVYTKDVVLTNPTNHEIERRDLVLIQLQRTGGTLVEDMRLVGCSLVW